MEQLTTWLTGLLATLFTGWKVGHTLQTIGLVGAAIAFGVGVWRYNLSQGWKRREFVVSEVDKLMSNLQARNAMVMLDYTLRTISLFPNRSPEYRQWARLDREFVAAMLMPHQMDNKELKDRPRYGQEGAAIRDCFDELLTRLANLQSMVVAGLIKQDDLKPYLAYWINKLTAKPYGDPTNKRFFRNLRLYINEYGFERVVELCSAMGRDMSIKPGDQFDLRADCADQKYQTLVEEKRLLMKEAAREFKLRHAERPKVRHLHRSSRRTRNS